MPRSNWKGAISFGLVSIPIALFNSENTSEKISFHQIDKRNNARVKYQRVNAETGEEVEWGNIIKGYVYDKNTVLPVGDDELQHVAGDNARTIAIEKFVKEDAIDLIYISKTYYLVPDKKGEKGYVILREALKKSKVMGIAKVIISTKEYVAAVGCYKNALVLYLLRYYDDIRPLSEFDIPADNLKKYKANTQEVNAAQLLIKSMIGKWDPKKYKDEYQAAVHKWAERKIKHQPELVMPQRIEAKDKAKNVEFIELLRMSLNASKKPKQESKKAPVHYAKKKSHAGKRAVLH